jgi:hypothetical protein
MVYESKWMIANYIKELKDSIKQNTLLIGTLQQVKLQQASLWMLFSHRQWDLLLIHMIIYRTLLMECFRISSHINLSIAGGDILRNGIFLIIQQWFCLFRKYNSVTLKTLHISLSMTMISQIMIFMILLYFKMLPSACS